MVKEICNKSITFCHGGKGRCVCNGTRSPGPQTLEKTVEDTRECINWCRDKGGMRGFTSNALLDRQFVLETGIYH